MTVFGLSGLRNAYRSVLSALGSSEISGASRWLEAVPALGPEPTTAAPSAVIATAPRAAAASAAFFMVPTLLRRWSLDSPRSAECGDRFDRDFGANRNGLAVELVVCSL